jgi:hypothetical protein
MALAVTPFTGDSNLGPFDGQASDVPAWQNLDRWRACVRNFSAKRTDLSQKATLFGSFGQLMPVSLLAHIPGVVATATPH